MNKVAMLVTTYTGGIDQDEKRYMRKTMCRKLKEQGHYVCLASHSTIDRETQSYCDYFIYDADNSFQHKGQPVTGGNYGIAIMRSTENALMKLKSLGFTHFFKVDYDNPPDIDYHALIADCEATGKKCVTTNWGDLESFSTMALYCEIDFYLKTLNLDENAHLVNQFLEGVWYRIIASKGLLVDVYVPGYTNNFFGRDIVSYYGNGGTTKMGSYPY